MTHPSASLVALPESSHANSLLVIAPRAYLSGEIENIARFNLRFSNGSIRAVYELQRVTARP